MNKGLLIVIGAVALLALGGVGYAMMNRPTTPNSTPVETGESQNPVFEARSLHDLLLAGENQTCTFTDTETGNYGTVYITNGSMRGDFTLMTNGTSSNSHMIVVDEVFYGWMDGQTQGFKSSIAQFQNTKETASTSQTMDINKQVDYKCSGWSVDSSKFEIPGDVEFMDMSAIMESVPTMTNQSTTPGSSNQCAVCDSLSGDTKTQCLQAFNCN